MKTFLIVSTVFLLVLTVLPFIPVQTGLIRMWSFPRLQIAAAMMMVLFAWLLNFQLLRNNMLLVLLLLIAIFHQVSKFIPYTFLWKPEIVDTKNKVKEQAISLLFYNVYMENKNTAAFLDLARKVNPDLILIAEADEFWRSNMEPLYSDYRYKVEVPLSNTYGMCLYSKLPLSSTEVEYLVEPDIPSIHGIVTLRSGQQVRLYCIHPEPPDLSKSTKDRDAELVIVAKEIANRTLPVIVAGDLNDVAWSSTTKLFGKLSNCNDPRVGRGLFSTFNAKYPLFRWPLDHFFTSNEFTLDRIDRLPKIGSDHFPITITFTYDPSSAGANKTKRPDEDDLEKAADKLKEEKEEDKEK